MGRRRKGNTVNGWINLDKPEGLTSTQAVGKVRRFLNAQKVGHGGTLDPLATGILPIALGEATKTIPYCQDHLKSYTFSIRWGEQRNTDDAEGEITATSDRRPTEKEILNILPEFIGNIQQIPPQFSAIKVAGERAYDRARDGKETVLPPRPVFIETIELLETQTDQATFRVICGKGTYMRSLARDIAKRLGTVGYIADLHRESVGPFSQNNAISLEILENLDHSAPPEDVLLPVETVLDDIPALALNEQEAARLKNGQRLTFFTRPDVDRLHRAGLDREDGETALAIYEGKPIALIEVNGSEIQPLRVLNL